VRIFRTFFPPRRIALRLVSSGTGGADSDELSARRALHLKSSAMMKPELSSSPETPSQRDA